MLQLANAIIATLQKSADALGVPKDSFILGDVGETPFRAPACLVHVIPGAASALTHGGAGIEDPAMEIIISFIADAHETRIEGVDWAYTRCRMAVPLLLSYGPVWDENPFDPLIDPDSPAVGCALRGMAYDRFEEAPE